MFIFWERQRASGGGAEREVDTESEAGSSLRVVSTVPDTGLEPTNHEIMVWAEVGHLTDWATHAPHIHSLRTSCGTRHWTCCWYCEDGYALSESLIVHSKCQVLNNANMAKIYHSSAQLGRVLWVQGARGDFPEEVACKKLFLQNPSQGIYSNFTFSKKIVANPQMWDHWHPPTPRGERWRRGTAPFPLSVRWLQWAEKYLALAFWDPEINVSGLQASADGMGAELLLPPGEISL